MPTCRTRPPVIEAARIEDFALGQLHKRKKDALGQIVGLDAVPREEQTSVKYFIEQYFIGGEKGEDKARNMEVDVNIPIARAAKGKPANVDYTLRFHPNNDVDVERVGVPDSKPLLQATGVDISRVQGFRASFSPAEFESFVKTRYHGVRITGTKLPEMMKSVNADMAARAGTKDWFAVNYGLPILDPAAAAQRLLSLYPDDFVKNQTVDQTADLKPFQPEELKSLEFALETMSIEELKLLRDVQVARQTVRLEFDPKKDKTVKPDPNVGAETFFDRSSRTNDRYL